MGEQWRWGGRFWAKSGDVVEWARVKIVIDTYRGLGMDKYNDRSNKKA